MQSGASQCLQSFTLVSLHELFCFWSLVLQLVGFQRTFAVAHWCVTRSCWFSSFARWCSRLTTGCNCLRFVMPLLAFVFGWQDMSGNYEAPVVLDMPRRRRLTLVSPHMSAYLTAAGWPCDAGPVSAAALWLHDQGIHCERDFTGLDNIQFLPNAECLPLEAIVFLQSLVQPVVFMPAVAPLGDAAPVVDARRDYHFRCSFALRCHA